MHTYIPLNLFGFDLPIIYCKQKDYERKQKNIDISDERGY